MAPDDPDKPADAHEHHGVVETLREEIEEVVEHVPQPVRWTVGKIVRLTLLALAALVVVAIVSVILYFANRTELVARETALILNQTLARRSDVVLDLRDLRGNPFTGFRAVHPRVRFRGDGAELVGAKALVARYPLWTLLRGGRGPIAVTLEEPVIRLTKTADGRWRLPTWKAGPKRAPGRGFDVQVKLVRGRVIAPAPVGEVSGLEFDAEVATGGLAAVRVKRLGWTRGPWDSRLDNLVASVRVDPDSVRVVLEQLRTGDVALRARAAWASNAKAPVRVVHAEVDRVRWAWLAKVFDNRTLDVTGEGAAVVDARGDRAWDGRFVSNLVWDSLAVQGAGRVRWDGRALAIDSLAGRTRAGDVTAGGVRWRKEGWEVFGRAANADPAHWDALQLHGWPAGKLNGFFRYVVDTRVKGRQESRLDARLGESEWVGWRVDSAVVRVDFAPVASDSFRVAGFRRGGRFDLAGRVETWGWGGPYAIADFPLEEWPDGRATGLKGVLTRGAGRVESRAGGLFVTGDLDGAATTWSAAQFARWRVSGVEGRLLPTPDLTANAVATDGFFTGIHLDSVRSSLKLGDENVTFPDLVAFAGDTTLTTTGNAAWNGSQWWTTLSSAEVRSAQLAWVAEPPVRIAGDAQGVVFERLVANDHDAHLEARGRWASPGGFYDFRADGARVDVGRVGMPLEWGMRGRASGTLVVSGRSGDPRFTFRGGARDPGMNGHAADSMFVALAGAPARLTVEDFGYWLGDGTARASGEFGRIARDWPDSLTGTAVFRWLAQAGTWRGEARADALPLERLANVSPRAQGWRGALSGTATLAGSPHAPEFEVRPRLEGPAWRDYRADRFSARVRYANRMLDVPEASLVMLGVESTARGRMPLVLAMDAAPVLPDEPMDWAFSVPSGDLQLVPLLVPQIQSARGRFVLAGTMTGTAARPKLAGSATVRDGVVRPAGRQEVLEGLAADFHFDESVIVLDSLRARQGRTGTIASRGRVRLDGLGLRDYAFDLGMRHFAAAEDGLYAMLFDADFKVTDGARVGGTVLPHVTGDVRLEKGVVEFDFANQSEVQRIAAQTQPLYWTYRLHLLANNNLRWRPPDGDIEFEADLDLEQTVDALNVYGEMHALRGTYFFLANRFTVVQADLEFDDQEGVNPTLDIVADAKVQSEPDASGGPRETETIRATITGRANQPVIDLAAVNHPSEWDQRRILETLAYNLTSNVQSLTLASAAPPLDNFLAQQLNNQLSRELSDFFRGAISEWELQRATGGLFTGAGDYYVRVGTQLTPQLALRYRQRLGGATGTTSAGETNPLDRDVEAEYRLSRFIFLTTEVSQRRYSNAVSQTGQGSPEVNVNLKARWEY